jgi:hypothetical protein
MANEIKKYATREARVLKGLATSTISTWEQQGWELVSQEPSFLQVRLVFRREKKNIPGNRIAFVGLAVACLVGAIVIGIQSENKSQDLPTSASTPVLTQSPDTSLRPNAHAPATLTVDNNADLSVLLSSNGENVNLNKSFFEKYNNDLIEFDGNIAYMALHGKYTTRFDLLIQSGDFNSNKIEGPPFRVRDVGYSDFHLTGPNPPDSVGQGDNIRVVGRITAWLDPVMEMEIVSTTIR